MRWFKLILLIGLIGCDKEEAEGVEVEIPEECEGLTYENFGRGELASWCTGCHSSAVTDREGAPAHVNFDTLDDVHEWSERILARSVGDEPTMPPVGGGDAEDRERLRIWLECGAP